MEKKNSKLFKGFALFAAFLVWTLLIRVIDVQAVGPNGSSVGFAKLNTWFHNLSGVHMAIYTITDWLGLVPIVICIFFGSIGLAQWIKRKSLLKVDRDIIALGIYYIVVIAGYLFFEMIPINYRPILIEGFLEASYPSSTTLLVLAVMLSVILQINRRVSNKKLRIVLVVLSICFSAFMVVGRLFCGVHWLTDIIGGVLLSTSLFTIYKSLV